MTRARSVMILLLVVAAPSIADAHVGSPNVYLEGAAGPYALFVTVTPPVVVPGVADLEIRCIGSENIQAVHITPLPLTGDGARFLPVPDLAERAEGDPHFFVGHLWMMSAGSWQVRIAVDGSSGRGELSVPVPALPSHTSGMSASLGIGLFVLMSVLAVGIIAIIGASVRESTLSPGVSLTDDRRTRARVSMIVAGLAVLLLLGFGRMWWSSEAMRYDRYVYKPIDLDARLDGARLDLSLADPGWLPSRRLDDLVPDHGHLMHLFLVREPALDRILHLHPVARPNGQGAFSVELPSIDGGRYRAFADVVHETGLGETGVAAIDLPEIFGSPPAGDDAVGRAPPIEAATSTTSPLEDGGRVVWVDKGVLSAKKTVVLRFRVEDAGGVPARGMGLYMGMIGHAAIVKSDFSVFAHVHPTGSVPMAAMMIANPSEGMHAQNTQDVPATIAFPFGFPSVGLYRLFVQFSRNGRIETASFVARVD
jgi:hypothetical protein